MNAKTFEILDIEKHSKTTNPFMDPYLLRDKNGNLPLQRPFERIDSNRGYDFRSSKSKLLGLLNMIHQEWYFLSGKWGAAGYPLIEKGKGFQIAAYDYSEVCKYCDIGWKQKGKFIFEKNRNQKIFSS